MILIHKYLITILLLTLTYGESFAKDKPRVFILTDINLVGGDPDDRQSWIHLLWYTDELELVGVVPDYWKGKGYEACLMGLEAYSKDFNEYNWHSKGFPLPKTVASKIFKTKQEAIERLYQESTDNSDPLYVLVWGSMVTLRDALFQYPDGGRLASRL